MVFNQGKKPGISTIILIYFFQEASKKWWFKNRLENESYIFCFKIVLRLKKIITQKRKLFVCVHFVERKQDFFVNSMEMKEGKLNKNYYSFITE